MKERKQIIMGRAAIVLALVFFLVSPALADPDNRPWGDTWEGAKLIRPNSTVRSYFGPEDMTAVDGFRFQLPAAGDVVLTVQGPGTRFLYTVEVVGFANEPESRLRNPAKWRYRNLAAGDYLVRVLWADAVRQGPIPETTYHLTLNYTPIGQEQPAAPPAAKPAAPALPSDQLNLIANGDFSQGLEGWQTGQSGYSGAKRAAQAPPVQTSSGCLRLAVCGGTRYALQKFKPADLRLLLSARFKVERWSTFNSGHPGGWAAVALNFRSRGRSLASTYYYLNPFADQTSRRGNRWIKLGPALPTPTGWQTVTCDVAAEAKHHGLDAGQIDELWVFAMVFGTHEDATQTVACFDDFSLVSLTRSEPGPAPSGSRPAVGLLARLKAELPGLRNTKRFISLKKDQAIVQFVWQGEWIMDVPGKPMTRAQRYRMQRLFTDHDRVNYQDGWSYHVYFQDPDKAAQAGLEVLRRVYGFSDEAGVDWSSGRM